MRVGATLYSGRDEGDVVVTYDTADAVEAVLQDMGSAAVVGLNCIECYARLEGWVGGGADDPGAIPGGGGERLKTLSAKRESVNVSQYRLSYIREHGSETHSVIRRANACEHERGDEEKNRGSQHQADTGVGQVTKESESYWDVVRSYGHQCRVWATLHVSDGKGHHPSKQIRGDTGTVY